MSANNSTKPKRTVPPIQIINNQVVKTKPIMNKNNNSQSQSENKRSLPQSPKTPTSTTSATTSKKTKYFISPNRYSALAETDLVTTDTANVTNNNQNDFNAHSQGSHNSTTHTLKKKDLPPPIFIKGVIHFSELSKAFSDLIGPDSFSCKSTSTHLKLQPNTPENYRKIINFLNENEAQFHTYQLQSDKAFRVVIRNLHPSTLVSEISLALEEVGHSVRKVTNILHYQTKNPLPLFFVDLEPDGNNYDIFDITSILHTKIRIEEPHKQRQIPQCTKCQSYGHTKSYCSYSPRCVKCGECHLTVSCTKSRESPAICALCNGNHLANYKGCTIYKELQQRRRYPSNTKQISQQQQFQHLNTQLNHQPTNPPFTNTRDRTYANVTGNDTTQNKNADSPSSNNLENFISKFLDDFKSMINPLLALLTTVISKLSIIKND
uniref:Nucleic-acid-binding protein n=1 Tax=Sipha flava TaxID=143950 RepID=A0A2S2R608_9HEMI